MSVKERGMEKNIDKALDEFLDENKCEELNELFYKTVKEAFKAGDKAKVPISLITEKENINQD